MANGILSQLRPGGTSGDQFNLRAANIFHFKTTTTQGAAPASGECSVASGILTVRNDNIVKLDVGMIISVRFGGLQGTFPTSVKVLGANGATIGDAALETSTINNNNLSELGWYVLIYDGASFKNINHTFTSSTSGSDNDLPTLGVVRSLLSNRWKVEVCPAVAAQIPAGAVYYDGTTTITGTMAASSATAYIIYLVRHNHTDSTTATDKDIYDEWITVNDSSWEKLGNTDVDLSGIITNIADHSHSITPTRDAHSHSIASVTSTGNFTPSGTLSLENATATGRVGVLTGVSLSNHTHTVSSSGTCEITKVTGPVEGSEGNYTPSGSVSKPNFTYTSASATQGSTAATGANHTHSYDKTTSITVETAANSNGNYTPAGSVSKPDFSYTSASATQGSTAATGANHTHSYEKTTSIDVTATKNDDGNYTPSGTVSQPTFQGNSDTTSEASAHSHTYTATGTISSTTTIPSGKTANYTPGGTVSATFSGASMTSTNTAAITVPNNTTGITASCTPLGTISSNASSGDVTVVTGATKANHNHGITHTAGTASSTNKLVTTVTHTAATGADKTINGIGNTTNYISAITGENSTVPSLTYTSNTSVTSTPVSVSGEILTLAPTTVSGLASITGWSAGTASTIGGTSTAFTSATVKEFASGGSITPSYVTISINNTDIGLNTTKLSFSGSSTNVGITDNGHTHTIAKEGVSVTGTTTGSITGLGFAGTGSYFTFAGTASQSTSDAGKHSHTVTPTGTVSKPTFTGHTVKIDATPNTTSTASSAAGAHSHSVTITGGAVSQPSFTGTKVLISATPNTTSTTSSAAGAHSHDVTITGGAVSQPSFTGDSVHFTGTASVSGTTAGAKSDVTPTTKYVAFNGTNGSVSVSTSSTQKTGTDASAITSFTISDHTHTKKA